MIKVENLSKKYTIGRSNGERYVALRDVVADKVKSIWNHGLSRPASEEFWALNDVSFEIGRGDRVGIIGRNGAGKSTLLKLISRITEPSKGKVSLRGRVASLLEVGTGFHPELTGRENIFLNGAVLGMGRAEIRRKFDEIVDFAEVERFLDTPVKRYSSGMYVRLAFAVAAHLEPEILLVDEVLAVGDVQFQEKCIGKMRDIAGNRQRTVLFVSHNMQAIRALCVRAILLERGQVSMDGETGVVINGYNASMRSRRIDEKTDIRDGRHRRGEGAIRFTSIEVTDARGTPSFNYHMGDTIHFRFSYETYKTVRGIRLFIGLKGGVTKEFVTSVEHVLTEEEVPPGTGGTATVAFPEINLRPGDYPLYFCLMDDDRSVGSADVVDEATLPIAIGVKTRGLRDGFDTRAPVGYVSLPSSLVDNRLTPGGTA